jgi:hypothetical protein
MALAPVLIIFEVMELIDLILVPYGIRAAYP